MSPTKKLVPASKVNACSVLELKTTIGVKFFCLIYSTFDTICGFAEAVTWMCSVLCHSCLPVNFAKFLRISFRWLLLALISSRARISILP